MKSFLKTLLASILGTFIAMFLCLLFFFGIIGSIMSSFKETEVIIPSKSILKIDMTTPFVDVNQINPLEGISLMGSSSVMKEPIGILSVIDAIRKAANDPAVKFIYLLGNPTNTNMANLDELREALKEFRRSGKAVVAYAQNYSQGSYYVASVADKVYINNFGSTDMIGIGSNMLFFKDLLDKIGVNVQLIRHGKFKAAAEQFVESNISKENLEQNQQMVSSLWNTWVEKIYESRGITPEELNKKVNNLDIFTAKSLVECNLVDETLTENEFGTKLCSLFGVEKEKNLVFTDIKDYVKAKKKPNIKIKDKIAVLYANGEITMDTKNTASAKELQKDIRLIKEDKNIKAVVLRVNSPGGDAQAAEIINNEIQSLREVKPVVVSMGEYAASGGYWIAANSEKIFADNNTITGSIGVFSLIPSFGKGLKEYLKINNISIKSNEHSDMLLGMRSLNNSEINFMQQMVDTVYTQFINLVSKGRNLSTQYVDSIGQGRVWTGADALKIKLVDEIGGLSSAINYAASLVNSSEFRLIEYPKPKSSFEQLMDMISTTNTNVKALNNPIELINTIYKNTITNETTKTYARTPYIYDFSY